MHSFRLRPFVSVVAVITAAAGCENPLSQDLFLEPIASEERLRNISSLTLTESPQVGEAAPDSRSIVDDVLARYADAGAESVPLSLADCRGLALENNLDLRVQLISPAIAAERVSEEEAAFEAVFFANADYTKTDTPTSSTLSGSQVENLSSDLGVRVPLRTGGTLTFDMPLTETETNNIFSTLNPAYTTDFSISFSQPLLRNAGLRANTHGIRLAVYESQISEAQTKLEVIRVLTAVEQAYWRLYAAREALGVRRQEFDLAVSQLDRARRQVNAGAVAEVEIIRAESGVADTLQGIILAENAVRDRERELKRLLNAPGLDVDSSQVLVPATLPNPVRYRLDPAVLLSEAMNRRMELLQLELQLAQDASTIDLRRNQVLPLVLLDYTYNVNGLGPTWGDSFDLLNDRNFEDHRIGVRVEVPLGNEAAESRLQQAVYSRFQRLASRKAREQLISQEVLNAIDQIESNWQRVLAGRQNVILNARTLEAEQRQFDLGLRTSTDVLDAQTNFANARLNELQALVEYQIAQVDLAFATGMVLGAAQVAWEPLEPQSDRDLLDPPAVEPAEGG